MEHQKQVEEQKLLSRQIELQQQQDTFKLQKQNLTAMMKRQQRTGKQLKECLELVARQEPLQMLQQQAGEDRNTEMPPFQQKQLLVKPEQSDFQMVKKRLNLGLNTTQLHQPVLRGRQRHVFKPQAERLPNGSESAAQIEYVSFFVFDFVLHNLGTLERK